MLHFLASQQITPAAHVSTQFKEADLAKADFIFCMEQQHLDKLADRYAQYIDKMWLLSDFAFGKDTDQPDPIGLEGTAFTKQAKQLQQAITACAERIKKDY